jgi:hypothetical protein
MRKKMMKTIERRDYATMWDYLKARFSAWWEKHVVGDDPNYDFDAEVVRNCNCANCRINGGYGYAHLEQVPEGKLGDYLALLDQKPNDMPPLQNAHRRFAFCFLAVARDGDMRISDLPEVFSNPVIAERYPLFLDPQDEQQIPFGYRWRRHSEDRWFFGIGEALYVNNTQLLYR